MTTMQPETSSSDVPLVGSPYDLRVALGDKVGETGIHEALDTGDWGFIHSFQTGSAVDGPGMRIVVAEQLPVRCLFCHNPHVEADQRHAGNRRRGEAVSQYRHGLHTMKGGLTISGGEARQHRFVLAFAAVQKLGVHTRSTPTDTWGPLSDEDLGCIDLVMLGLKAITPELHHRLTGKDTQPVHAFARRLADLRRRVWVRFVIVPGWTDNLDEVGKMADFAAGLGNVERVDVLPFHQLGRFKWDQLGMEYQMRDATPPSQETIEKIQARFRSAGLNVV